MQEARDRFEEALRVEAPPDAQLSPCARGTLKILLALQLPPLFNSTEHLVQSRQLFVSRLQELTTQKLFLPVPPARGASNDTLCDMMPMAFTVVYHGMNAYPLIDPMAKALRQAVPSLAFEHKPLGLPRVAERRVRVGFVSAYLDNHPAGRAWGGVMVNLPRDRLEVIALSLARDPERSDHQYKRIRDGVERYIELGQMSFEQIRLRIRELDLDILVYLEIGMDALTYFLAFARLAPIQCLTYGHSMTSGTPLCSCGLSLTIGTVVRHSYDRLFHISRFRGQHSQQAHPNWSDGRYQTHKSSTLSSWCGSRAWVCTFIRPSLLQLTTEAVRRGREPTLDFPWSVRYTCAHSLCTKCTLNST